MQPIRTLPLRVALADGESLHSWLLRLAHRNGIPLLRLAPVLGLVERLRTRRVGCGGARPVRPAGLETHRRIPLLHRLPDRDEWDLVDALATALHLRLLTASLPARCRLPVLPPRTAQRRYDPARWAAAIHALCSGRPKTNASLRRRPAFSPPDSATG